MDPVAVQAGGQIEVDVDPGMIVGRAVVNAALRSTIPVMFLIWLSPILLKAEYQLSWQITMTDTALDQDRRMGIQVDRAQHIVDQDQPMDNRPFTSLHLLQARCRRGHTQTIYHRSSTVFNHRLSLHHPSNLQPPSLANSLVNPNYSSSNLSWFFQVLGMDLRV